MSLHLYHRPSTPPYFNLKHRTMARLSRGVSVRNVLGETFSQGAESEKWFIPTRRLHLLCFCDVLHFEVTVKSFILLNVNVLNLPALSVMHVTRSASSRLKSRDWCRKTVSWLADCITKKAMTCTTGGWAGLCWKALPCTSAQERRVKRRKCYNSNSYRSSVSIFALFLSFFLSSFLTLSQVPGG